MRDRKGRYPPKKHAMSSGPSLAIIGALLLTAGLLLLFLCIPGWAWMALLGCLLASVGVVLIRLSGRRGHEGEDGLLQSAEIPQRPAAAADRKAQGSISSGARGSDQASEPLSLRFHRIFIDTA